jgi:hypothetical protein
MPILLFAHKNLTIQYEEGDDYLWLTWSGFTEGETFRDLSKEIIVAIDHTRTVRILSDNTNWKALSPNDHGWASQHWFPWAEEKGVQMLATVPSHDFFSRDAERTIEAMAETRCMQIKNFNSIEQARSWLIDSKNAQECEEPSRY